MGDNEGDFISPEETIFQLRAQIQGLVKANLQLTAMMSKMLEREDHVLDILGRSVAAFQEHIGSAHHGTR